MGFWQRWQERRQEKKADRVAIAREQLDEIAAGEDPEAGYDPRRNTSEAKYPQLNR
jgi:hypothetical protein